MLSNVIKLIGSHLDKNSVLRLSIAFVFLILSKVALLYSPFYFSNIITWFQSDSESYNTIIWLIYAYGLSNFCSTFFEQLKQLLLDPLITEIKCRLATSTLSHIYNLPYEYHSNQSAGSIPNKISKGLRSFSQFSMILFFWMIPLGLEILCTTFILCYILPWHAGIITITLLSFLTLLLTKITRNITKTYRDFSKNDERLTSKIVDAINTIEIIHYEGAQDQELSSFVKTLHPYKKSSILFSQSCSKLQTCQSLLINCINIIYFFSVTYSFSKNHISIHQVILLITYWTRVTKAIEMNAYNLNQLNTLCHDINELDSLNLIKEKNIEPHALNKITEGKITFRNVSFNYFGTNRGVSNIIFEIKPGQTMGLVGTNGAGKTTILRLLLGLLVPKKGQILIDDNDIHSIDKENLRSSIAIIPQRSQLLNETIAYNLKYTNPQATKSDIKAVLTQVHLEQFIQDLPQGINTIVGTAGMKLSGGELQKIAIARALLKKPKILICDEIYIGLDTHCAYEIQKILKALSGTCTQIVVTHDLTKISHADTIMVLNNGIIAESGTHMILLEKKQLYSSLYNSQSTGYS